MQTTISSEFRIRGNTFDPLELSKLLRMKPSVIWKKGDAIERSPIMKRKDNAWVLKIKEQPSLSVENQLKKLLNRVESKIPAIVLVCKKLNLQTEFSFAIYIENNITPSVYLNPILLRKVVSLNATLDIGIYCLTE